MDEFKIKAIGHMRTPYQETGQIPRGLGTKHSAEGTIEVLPELAAGLQDIEGFSHIVVVWVFHQSEGYDLVGTPPSDNRPHGVFATRSPRRPNPIGLTVLEVLRHAGNSLHVRGVDMLDGTPVIDIKPYTSSIPEDKLPRGWLAEAEKRSGK